MRRLIAPLALVLSLSALTAPAQVTIQHGNTLSQLINNLYGGNGIQLKETGHQAHFGESLDFQQFSETLQQVLQARPLYPIPSSVGLVSFRFNEETGTYERVEGSSGPLLAERATTTGRGNVNIATTYTFSEFQTFNGNETIDLRLTHCLLAQCISNIASPYLKDTIGVTMRMRLKSQAWTTSVSYGATNNLDLGVVVPYIRNDLQIATHARVILGPQSTPPGPHEFDLAIETPDQLGTAHAIGIGDIVARAKLRLARKLPFDFAVLADVALPTGDKKNFLGTGSTRVKTTAVASKSGARFTPHLNAGIEYHVDNSDLTNLDYRFGSEVLISPRLTVTADLLGVARPMLEDSFRARAAPGEELIAESEIDGVLGGKWKVSPRTVFLFNLLTPLNDRGIRPSEVVTFGFQFGL